MTREEIDRLWFQAMEESIKDNEMVARYHFAAFVAAAELHRLHEENERCREVCKATSECWRTEADELEAQRERLSALLSATAIALRGPEPELTRWSWHDLPDRVAALVAQREALLEALKEIVAAADGTGWDQLDASFSKARAAIAKAEEKA